MQLRLLVAVTATALTLTACSGSSDSTAKKADDAKQGSSQKLVETSPMTGKPFADGAPANPVFVVKIENTDGGQPQYGLDKADMVLEELVEGGLTRLAAFFYSRLPSKVGHVRSLRTSDIGIAGPVGGQIVASGGASGSYSKVQRAGIKVFSEDAGAPGFSSDPLKVRPYNRLIDLKAVAKKAKRTTIKNPYLPWTSTSASSAAPSASTSRRATSATVRFSSSTATTWKLSGGKWTRTNGHAEPGHDFAADTMLVLYARVGDAGYTDPAGNPVPVTVFEGAGKGVVFHGKDVTDVTWHKKGLKGRLTLTKKGKAYTIDPGHVFIELVPKGEGSVTLG